MYVKRESVIKSINDIVNGLFCTYLQLVDFTHFIYRPEYTSYII